MGNEASKKKTIPPLCHVTETRVLKFGDQVYRRLNGINAIVGYHHAIVINAKVPYLNDKCIKVIEMTREYGIRINTLHDFLNGHRCRLVYYNTKQIHQTFHAYGTCHVEKSSSNKDITKRIEMAKEIMNATRRNSRGIANPHIYHVLKLNCEEFAVWIKTGLYNGVQLTQVVGYKQLASNTFQSGQGGCQSVGQRAIAEVADNAVNAITTGSDNAASTVTRVSTTEVAVNTIKYSAKSIGLGIGISLAIETVCTGYKVWKYKKVQ